MFEVQKQHYSLMTDYTKLVISGLKRKYKIFSPEQIEEKLLSEFTPIDEDYVFDMDADYQLMSFKDVKEFIEDRIGEDFVVLDEFENYAFCIHEVDDFLTEVERLEKAQSKQKQIKEFYEEKLAA
jgi:hypothetical protein